MKNALPLPQVKYGITTYLSLDEFDQERVARAKKEYSTYEYKNAERVQLQSLEEFWATPRGKAIFQILKKEPKNQIEQIQQEALKQGKAILIPSGKTIKQPILLKKHCATFLDADTLVIIAEKNSEASIIDAVTSTEECYLRTQRMHIILEENARLSFCNMQNLDKKTYNFVNKSANVSRNAGMHWIDGCFGGSFMSSTIQTTLAGENASMEANTMFFAQGDQQFDLAVEARHVAQNTTSNMKTVGVGKDKSKTVYRGNIKIHEHASNSNGYQKEDTLILSDEATVDAIPKLEIDNHDVKCKHGATVGQIDRNKLFYLESRGLSRGEAQAAIIKGFFIPTIEKIDAEELKERLIKEIEEKTAFLIQQ